MAAEEDKVDGCTRTLGLMQHGTVVVMTSLNHMASQYTAALMVGVEKFFGCL